MNPESNGSRSIVPTGRPCNDLQGMCRHEVWHHAWQKLPSRGSNCQKAAKPNQVATRRRNQTTPPRGGRARSGRHDAGEADHVPTRRPNQARLPGGGRTKSCRRGVGKLGQAAIVCPKQRNLNPDSKRARSGSHEAGEGEVAAVQREVGTVARGDGAQGNGVS
jgi:hypothetical protein